MRLWETPVPIPNTMVKTQAADGTALETVWESRWPPDQKRNFTSDQSFESLQKIQSSDDWWSKSEVGQICTLKTAYKKYDKILNI